MSRFRGGSGLPWRGFFSLAALAFLACGVSPKASSSCWTTLPTTELMPAKPLSWQVLAELPIAAGERSEPLTLPSADAVLRLSTTGCAQVDSLSDGSGTAWVTPPATLADYDLFCKSCPQRVSLAVHHGLYVLPSSDPLPLASGPLTLRATRRDCDTLLPSQQAGQVRVEAALPSRPDSGQVGVLSIELLITSGSIFYGDADVLPATVEKAIALVNSWLAPGQLSLRIVRSRRMMTEDPLRISRGDHSALEQLHSAMHACDGNETSPDDSWVPLVLAGCLSVKNTVTGRSSEPEGLTPSIPNGLPIAGGAHGVYIKGRGCDASSPQIEWTAESLARVLGHELGHYLGLYHSVELDGDSDALTDTDADNIMYARPSAVDQPRFSSHQFRVMRQHPAIAWQ